MPFEYSNERIVELTNSFNKYIEETEMPIISEFAFLNNVRREFLYENSIMSNIRKQAILKKESYLERAGLDNKVNSAICRLSLMQLGWLDRTQTENLNLNTDSPEDFKKAQKEIEKAFE
jgi:hypothetical protein